MRVHIVDVGQGDGTIWEMPDGSLVVYDCGPAASSSAQNPMTRYLSEALGRPPGSPILVLVASHGHLDHIGGCEEIFEDYHVEHVFDQWYQGSDAPASYRAFQQQVRDEGAVLHDLADDPAMADDVRIQQGDGLPLAAGGPEAEFVWPTHIATKWDSIADTSLVLRLSFGSVSFCFQGDIESAQEASIASSPLALPCTVYLMGHHGSKYASSASWLAKMQPTYAPVSFGENGYGHPTPEALCRVQQVGAHVYATHRLGTITFETNGTAVKVTPDQPEAKDYCASGASYW
jgi:competence protein ComEC